MSNENERAECKDCGIVLIDDKGVIRVHPYIIDGDSVCEACREKRYMIARRYGKKLSVGKTHPVIEKVVEEHNEKIKESADKINIGDKEETLLNKPVVIIESKKKKQKRKK